MLNVPTSGASLITLPAHTKAIGVQVWPKLRIKQSNDWESRWLISATLPKLGLHIFAYCQKHKRYEPGAGLNALSLGNQRPWAMGWRNQAMSWVGDAQDSRVKVLPVIIWCLYEFKCCVILQENDLWRDVWISVLLCKSQGHLNVTRSCYSFLREVWVKLHNSEEKPYSEGQITHLRSKTNQSAVDHSRITTPQCLPCADHI